MDGLLNVAHLTLQVSLVLDHALCTESGAVRRLEGQVLLREETLLDMGFTQAAHQFLPDHHIDVMQHGGIVQPGGRVCRPAVTIRG